MVVRTLQAVGRRRSRPASCWARAFRSWSPARYDTMEVRMASCVLASLLMASGSDGGRESGSRGRLGVTDGADSPPPRSAFGLVVTAICAVRRSAGMMPASSASFPNRVARCTETVSVPRLARARHRRGRCARMRSPGSSARWSSFRRVSPTRRSPASRRSTASTARSCRPSSPRCGARRGTRSPGRPTRCRWSCSRRWRRSPCRQPTTTSTLVLTLALAGRRACSLRWDSRGSARWSNFISHTVIVGFTAGAGLLIIAAQLSQFLRRRDSRRRAIFFASLRGVRHEHPRRSIRGSRATGVVTLVVGASWPSRLCRANSVHDRRDDRRQRVRVTARRARGIRRPCRPWARLPRATAARSRCRRSIPTSGGSSCRPRWR